MTQIGNDLNKSEEIHIRRDYQYLKNLLDEGKEVSARIQILPCEYGKRRKPKGKPRI